MKKKLTLLSLVIILVLLNYSYLFLQKSQIVTSNDSQQVFEEQVDLRLVQMQSNQSKAIVAKRISEKINARTMIKVPDANILIVSDRAAGQIKAYYYSIKEQSVVINHTWVIAKELDNALGLSIEKNNLWIVSQSKIFKGKDWISLLKQMVEKPTGSPVEFKNEWIDWTKTNESWHGGKYALWDPVNELLYYNAGAACNICTAPNMFANQITAFNPINKEHFPLIEGTRNVVGMTLDHQGNLLFTQMGADNLGDDFPPETVWKVDRKKLDQFKKDKKALQAGFPFCHAGTREDENFKGIKCDQLDIPVIARLTAHSAPLGIVEDSEKNIWVALHGSWNRSVPSGYQIIVLSADKNEYKQKMLINGFAKASARPVDIVLIPEGIIYSDDGLNGLFFIKKPF